MRRQIIISLITIAITCSFVSSPCLAQYEVVFDVLRGDETPHIAVDDSGYVYAAYLENWAIETTKLDSLGNSVWTRTKCDGLACKPHDIALDASANVYVLGTMDYLFDDTLMGDCNLVVIKYDSSGNQQWIATFPFTTDLHYPDFRDDVFGVYDAIWGKLEVSPDGHSYVWGNRWDLYDIDNHVRRQKNGFLLVYDNTGVEIMNRSFECPFDHPSMPGLPADRIEGVHAIDRDGNVSIAIATWADLEICPNLEHPDLPDTAFQEAIWFYEAEVDGSQLYEERHFRDNLVWVPCVGGYDGTWSVTIAAAVFDLCIDGLGNNYVFGCFNYAQYGDDYHHNFAAKLDPDWNPLWSTPLSSWQPSVSGLAVMDVDSVGNVVIADMNNVTNHQLWRLDPDGHVVGTDGFAANLAVKMDDAGNAYVGGTNLQKYDADFNPVWRTWWNNSSVRQIEVDRQGGIYFTGWPWNGTPYISKIEQVATMVIRDAHNDTIPNVEFELIKVSNDPPDYTEDTLGTFTTNDMGQLKLRMVRTDSLLFATGPGNDTPDTLAIGDTLKVSKHIHSQPAVKHPGLLSTAYSIHLDNGEFDPEGVLSFDTLELGVFDVVLNHTEIRHNLVASVEWEASFAYLDALEENFRYMSNYLYDVSDGQLRLDTVMIYDHREQWDGADMRIHATNNIRASAYVGGMYSAINDWAIYMPRKAFFSDVDRRNNTDINPLLMVDVSGDYRTKAHEFGHYAMSFYDEYMLFDGTKYVDDQNLRCLAFPLSNYGFMDHQFEQFGEKSSEMSSTYRYDWDPCQNTMQWGYNNSSCWDQLESAFEWTWGADNIYAPILKPDADDEKEHNNLTPSFIFPGPNDDMNNLNYDAGGQITFPVASQPQEQDFSNVHIKIVGTYFPENAVVELVNNPLTISEQIINQGAVSDAGQMWILGVYDPTYWILTSIGRVEELYTRALSSDQYRKIWQYGIAQQYGSADSLEISMQEVQGDYPLICEVDLQAGNFAYSLIAEQSFAQNPSLSLYPANKASSNHNFISVTDGYIALIGESIGDYGSIIIWAEDDSSERYFFPTAYTVSVPDYSQPLIEFFGPSNQSRFIIDTSNSGIDEIMVLSSPYPVVRIGLDPTAIQAGETQCVSVYPVREIQASSIAIRYSDVDLKVGDQSLGDESTLEIYYWGGVAQGWQTIGGSVVDTARNEVWGPLTNAGTYALFTTNVVTGVEDDEHGEILPYKFELSQNYPNPFNPVTTIEYNLPRRSSVRIDIFNLLGQKVQTLINYDQSAGSYTITWNGTNAAGESVSTGFYFYRFQAGDYVETKKMLLLK